MLSSDVLEELLRPSLVRTHIIYTAWPSLSVESKLQIISALQNTDPQQTLHEDILRIALADEHAIVRYWAVRFERLKQPLPEEVNPVVKAMAAATDGFSQPDGPGAQFIRLFRARNGPADRYSPMEGVISPIITAIETKSVSDEMLGEYLCEFLQSPWLRKEIKADEMSDDGWSHFQNVKQITRLIYSKARGPD
jgi:hypothetical protein